MPQVDETQREIQLDEDTQDAVLIVTKDGEVLMIEPPFDGPQPNHVRMVEGICKALTDPELFQEIIALAERGNMLDKHIPTSKPPTIN